MFRLPIVRFEPCTCRKLHDASAHVLAQHRCSKAAAALVEQPDDITIHYTARCRVGRVDADRLPVLDLRRTAELTIIKLAMQTLVRLVANQMQRIGRSIRFDLYPCGIPVWMALAIVVAKIRDRLRKYLDLAGWSLQRGTGRIVTEGACWTALIGFQW